MYVGSGERLQAFLRNSAPERARFVILAEMMVIHPTASEVHVRTWIRLAVPARRFLCRSLLSGTVLACLAVFPAVAETAPPPSGLSEVAESPKITPAALPEAVVRRANFNSEVASAEVQEVAQWVVGSADNQGRPFIIIDKVQAKVFVFDAQGQLRGASVALLGLAIGDQTVPGIGQRKLSTIRPEERTTPAGRFVASLDRDIHGEEVLWVDYDSSVSLHRVVPGTPKERRAQRLASPSPRDKRITYGCINVPVKFYEGVVSPAFKGTDGIVYVLPETRSARSVFGSS